MWLDCLWKLTWRGKALISKPLSHTEVSICGNVFRRQPQPHGHPTCHMVIPHVTWSSHMPHGHPTCGRKKCKVNSSIKQRPLVVASWNVRTLQDTGLGARRRTAIIACELARYNIDIAALSETRFPNEGSLVEMGLITHFPGVAYPKLPVAFLALDLLLGLRFCRAPRNLPLH